MSCACAAKLAATSPAASKIPYLRILAPNVVRSLDYYSNFDAQPDTSQASLRRKSLSRSKTSNTGTPSACSRAFL